MTSVVNAGVVCGIYAIPIRPSVINAGWSAAVNWVALWCRMRPTAVG